MAQAPPLFRRENARNATAICEVGIWGATGLENLAESARALIEEDRVKIASYRRVYFDQCYILGQIALKGQHTKAQGNALGMNLGQLCKALKGRNKQDHGINDMVQSLSNVLLHLVFSTKNRRPWIDTGIKVELAKYIAGICRELKCPSHKIGKHDDHVHIACSLSRTMSISKLIEGRSLRRFRMAEWVCRVLDRTITIRRFAALHCQSARTSTAVDVSRKVSRAFVEV